MKQYFSLQYWKGQRLLLLTFLLLHIIVASVFISQQDITHDEAHYFTYAVRWLQGKVDRSDKMYDSKTPLVAIAVLPRIIRQINDPGYVATDFGRSDVLNGRYFMVIYTIIIALYLFVWIRRAFGAKAWILPVLFFLFEPNILGYSMIVTSDMASGACLLATMYHLFVFYKERKAKQFIFFSIWLGVSFVCKASLIFLLPCLLLLVLGLLLARKISNILKIVKFGFLAGLISLLVVNAAYFFKGSFQTFGVDQFNSSSFKMLSETFLLKDIPIPLPANYVAALDLLKYHGELGGGLKESSYPGVYLNGATSYDGTFWYYYLYVGLYKIPVAIILLLVTGVLLLAMRLPAKFLERHIWYILPATFFFIVLSLFNPFQIGFRHFLVLYPMLFVGIAAVLSYTNRKYKYAKLLGYGVLIYMFVSVGAYFPYELSYTNEFLLSKKTIYRKINDSSLDYGQNRLELRQFLEDHPGYHQATFQPQPGKLIVPAAMLFDQRTEPDCSWLAHFTPIGHYHYSMFLYEISQEDIEQLQQKSRP